MSDEKLIANSSVIIKAPADTVWDALVNPELIKQYMFGTTVISDWAELSSDDGRTHLTLTQDNNASEQACDESEKNWDAMLSGMKRLIESRAA